MDMKQLFSGSGNLEIVAAGSSSQKDFDFLIGKWTVQNRKLKSRLKEKDIIVQFRWEASNPHTPVWSQAFSPNNGQTWEWNWYMTFNRKDEGGSR